jgi:hypothetical protein
MTNGRRNHPGNRKGLLQGYLIAAFVVIVLAIAGSAVARALLY